MSIPASTHVPPCSSTSSLFSIFLSKYHTLKRLPIFSPSHVNSCFYACTSMLLPFSLFSLPFSVLYSAEIAYFFPSRVNFCFYTCTSMLLPFLSLFHLPFSVLYPAKIAYFSLLLMSISVFNTCTSMLLPFFSLFHFPFSVFYPAKIAYFSLLLMSISSSTHVPPSSSPSSLFSIFLSQYLTLKRFLFFSPSHVNSCFYTCTSMLLPFSSLFYVPF
jgi:hypothetical protein